MISGICSSLNELNTDGIHINEEEIPNIIQNLLREPIEQEENQTRTKLDNGDYDGKSSKYKSELRKYIDCPKRVFTLYNSDYNAYPPEINQKLYAIR